ncbi:MAG: VanZ family protein [Anaerolineae bacterium]
MFSWAPLLLWLATIWWLSSQPSLPHPNRQAGVSDNWLDYPAHALAYAVLTLLFWRALSHEGVRLPHRLSSTPVRNAALLAILYGALDELHQSFVPGRCATLVDWITDIAGALCAVALLALWRRVRKHLPFRHSTASVNPK